MQNKTRRIKVNLEAISATDVLIALGQKNVTVFLDILDTKETYKILSGQGIIDWDFISSEDEKDSNNSFTEVEDETDVCENVKVPSEFSQLYKTLNQSNKKAPKYSIKDVQGLAFFIEAVWRVAKERPNIRFGTELFEYTVTNELTKILESQSTGFHLSTERAMVKLLLEVYYGLPNSDIEVAFSDTLEKLEKCYSLIKEADTLNKVANILYRYEREIN